MLTLPRQELDAIFVPAKTLPINSFPAYLSESASLDTSNILVGFHINQPAHVSPSAQLHQHTRHLNIISLRLIKSHK